MGVCFDWLLLHTVCDLVGVGVGVSNALVTLYWLLKLPCVW